MSVNTKTTTDEAARMMWVLIWYLGVLPAVWIAPLVFSCCRRLRFRGGATEHSPDAHVAITEVGATAAQLEAAEQACRRLHLRVNGSLWQLGWILSTTAILPLVPVTIVRRGGPTAMDPTPVVGSYVLYCALLPWGLSMTMLSVRPSEAARIRGVLRGVIVIVSVGNLTCLLSAFQFFNAGWTEYAIVSASFALSGSGWVVSCAHSLYGHRCFRTEPTPPRRQLQRMWLGLYVWLLTFSISATCTGIFRWLCSGTECVLPPLHHVITGVVGLLNLLVSAPANRGRIIRRLG